ncbi:hypothetical protein BUX72_06365 [Campylobacter jejuni]|nr:hypothetical protein [Campylobacter jejuni]ECO2860440.1 hypothetical protein [Campylobacter jejuni]ECO3488654.1 hypothetical protein [Campylobacter jejuni]ECQ1573533.1 hypothetical protein [Campylobacter jejuni]ELP5829100.1 hypothetical protein [Campylobacter jejuni]
MQTKIFNSFFFQYGRYLQYDLIHSLEQKTRLGRNIDLLITFRKQFDIIITSNLSEKEAEHLKKVIKKAVDDYIGDHKNECLDIDLTSICCSSFNYGALFEEDFKEIFTSFRVSCSDFKKIDAIEHEENSQEFAKDKDERSVLIQALLEFNNALSHIFTSVYHGNDDLGNINKAKNHLYRGTLDNYKMFIRLSIKSVKQKNPKLFEEFKDIRIQELLHLGKDVQGKVINNEYLHKQYKELYNKSLSYLDEKSNSQTLA